MKRYDKVLKVYAWLISLMMLTGCTSNNGVKCNGRLIPINSPASVHNYEEPSAVTSGMKTQEVEP